VVFVTLFVMVLFSSLIVTLSVFYLSRDLEMVHAMPVSTWPIVFTRSLRTVLHSSWMVLIFSLPLYVAYGVHYDGSPLYYIYLMACFVPFVAIPCFLGNLLIMVLMRYFPTQKAHQILSLLGMGFLIGLVMYLRFLSPEKFFGKEVSDEMIMLFVESLKVPDYAFLPSSWITMGMTGWVAGDRGRALEQLVHLWAVVTVLVATLWLVSRKIYFDGWCLTHEIRNAPLFRNDSGSNNISWLSRLPFSPIQRALLAKDMKIFARDPEQWSQLFILCALVAVYIFNIMNLPLDNVVLKNWVSVLNIGLVGFVLSALTSRFVYSATSMEGKMFWTVYTAPLDLKKYLWAKFWMFFPPLLLIAEILVVASNYLLQVDSYVMTVSMVGVFLITLSLVGLGLGLGAMYPVFDHENVSEIPFGTGGILFMVSSLGFVLLVLALGGRPMYVYFNERFLHKATAGVDVMICYGLIVLLTMAVAFLPLKLGVQALKKMDI